VLPFGVHNRSIRERLSGNRARRAIAPKLWRRALYTTLLSIPVTALLLWAIGNPTLQQYWS